MTHEQALTRLDQMSDECAKLASDLAEAGWIGRIRAALRFARLKLALAEIKAEYDKPDAPPVA